MPSDPSPECEACQGTTRIEWTEKHTVDAGSKWARSFDIPCDGECEVCNGAGVAELSDDWIHPGHQLND